MTDNVDLDAIEARAKTTIGRYASDSHPLFKSSTERNAAVDELLAEVRRLREALANPDDGKIWMAIKQGLMMGHESMRKIVDAQKFEESSVHEDDLARKLEARVSQALKEPSHDPH